MKLMERMKQKRLGNKGFSLVELIIVIAIMAILIGIVGTQVIPYLRRAREEKDMQIIDAFATAGVTFYSLNSDLFVEAENAGDSAGKQAAMIILNTTRCAGDGKILSAANISAARTPFQELTGYATIGDVQSEMTSAVGKTIKSIVVYYNFEDGTVTARGYSKDFTGSGIANMPDTTNPDADMILEPAVAHIGKLLNIEPTTT